MSFSRPALLFPCILLALSNIATAQSAPWCLDGPNAALRLQGLDPSAVDPANHDVPVTLPGVFRLSVLTNANPGAGLLVLASALPALPQAGLPVGSLPWDTADSLDIGAFATPLPTGVQVIGDGLNPPPGSIANLFFASDAGNIGLGLPPTFELTYNVGPGLAGSKIALQTIVRDPGNPPFNLDSTQAVNAELTSGVTIGAFVGDDGTTEVVFPPGITFDFHGTSYSSVWLVANGYVNFGGPTTVVANGFTTDFVSLVSREPFISVHTANWDPGVIGYRQNGGIADIVWGDPSQGGSMTHAVASDAGNVFSLRLELTDGINPLAGSFRIRHDFLVDNPAQTINDYGDGARGHGPGGSPATVTVTSTDLNRPGTSNAGETVLEEHSLTGASVLNGWDGAGSARGYHNADRNWNGGQIDFTPNPAVAISGDTGYTSSPNAIAPWQQPEDVGRAVDLLTGLRLPGVMNTGPQTVTVAGSFEQLIDATGPTPFTVVFDTGGLIGGPFTGTLVGIFDSSGTLAARGVNPAFILPGGGPGTPHRDMQACQVTIPSLPAGAAGTIDMTFTFASGVTRSNILPILPTLNVQSFTMATNASTTVPLAFNTVPFYGTSYSSLAVGSNGQVTFGGGSASAANSVTNALNGWGIGTTEPGCGLWFNLNLGGAASGSTYAVTENLASGETTVSFNNMIDWGTGNALGSWTIAFDGQGRTTFDFGNMLQALDSNATLAYSDGDGLLGTTGSDTVLTNGIGTGLASVQGVYFSGITFGTFAPDSVAEDIPIGVDLRTNFQGAGVLNVLDAGLNGTLVIF